MRTNLGAAMAVLCVGCALAQPEPWLHPDGTTHYYDAVGAPAGIDWYAALDSAQGPGGYLATITSQVENDLVFGLADTSLLWFERPGTGLWAVPWLGGFQPAGSTEPAGGWTWATDEPFTFANWSSGEPDNSGNENALHFGEAVGSRVSTWDDVAGTDGAIRGYVAELSAESTTVGLVHDDSAAFVGYTLFAPDRSRTTFLIDNKGRLINSWPSPYVPGMSACLLDNGDLLRAACVNNQYFDQGGTGGRVEQYDWNGSLVWAYDYSSNLHCQHHDIKPLPNGNVVLVAWELKTRAEAIAAGRNPAKLADNELWPDHVIEVNPASDSIVWEWHLWDHLIQDFDSTRQNYGVVQDHPELVDVNFTQIGPNANIADWTHVNSIDYNPEFDQLILSSHHLHEIWVIDHSTTTEQARGHTGGRQGMGGDILYRWGNPQAYRAGTQADRKFYGQHDARWVEEGLPGEGHIMVLNNGPGRPQGWYSTVDEFIPAVDSTGHYERPAPGSAFGPAAQCWVFMADPPASFYSAFISSAHRLPNGNTFICEGLLGEFLEVTSDAPAPAEFLLRRSVAEQELHTVVWRYVNPVVDTLRYFQGDTIPDGITGGQKENHTFRATRYAPGFPGFAGKDMTPGYPIERYASPPLAVAEPTQKPVRPRLSLAASPSPALGQLTVHYGFAAEGRVRLSVWNLTGAEVRRLVDEGRPSGLHSVTWDGTAKDGTCAGPGVYFLRLEAGVEQASLKIVLE